MFTRKLALAAIAGCTLLAASSAFAHDGHGNWRHGQRWHGHGHPSRVVVMPAPRVVYTPPPRVVYAPPPAVVYQPPLYLAPQATIVYRQHGLTVGVGF